MYKSFRVKNFRCFKDLQINDLGRVNLIAGRNNTGKTALMEAMYIHSGNRESKTLLRPVVTSRNEEIIFRSRRGYINTFDIASWNSLFNEFNTDVSIEMVAEFDTKPRQLDAGLSDFSLQIHNVTSDRDDFLEILQEYKAEDDDDVQILEFIVGFDSSPFHLLLSEERIRSSRSKRHTLLEADFLHTRELINPKDDNDRLADMKQDKTDAVLINALRMLEPRLKGLEILYERIHADVGISKSIPLTSMGDGINRIASMILAMSKVPNGVIFIDEIENGIHHSVQVDIWEAIGKLAREQNIQVFATTHSLEMIRAAFEAFNEEGNLDIFRFHRLDRMRDTGEIKAVTYNKRALEAVAAFAFDFEVRG